MDNCDGLNSMDTDPPYFVHQYDPTDTTGEGTTRYNAKHQYFSVFDYAVLELRFTDAAAQRRIQAMRLCRRHGWVRASLQSGELSMTSAAQLETTFAGAERAERQCRTAHRNVGQGRCHDQDHDSAGRTRQLGLPAAPGEAGEQGERGP